MQLFCLRLSELAGDERLTARHGLAGQDEPRRQGARIAADARDILGGNGILLEAQRGPPPRRHGGRLHLRGHRLSSRSSSGARSPGGTRSGLRRTPRDHPEGHVAQGGVGPLVAHVVPAVVDQQVDREPERHPGRDLQAGGEGVLHRPRLGGYRGRRRSRWRTSTASRPQSSVRIPSRRTESTSFSSTDSRRRHSRPRAARARSCTSGRHVLGRQHHRHADRGLALGLLHRADHLREARARVVVGLVGRERIGVRILEEVLDAQHRQVQVDPAGAPSPELHGATLAEPSGRPRPYRAAGAAARRPRPPAGAGVPQPLRRAGGVGGRGRPAAGGPVLRRAREPGRRGGGARAGAGRQRPLARRLRAGRRGVGGPALAPPGHARRRRGADARAGPGRGPAHRRRHVGGAAGRAAGGLRGGRGLLPPGGHRPGARDRLARAPAAGQRPARPDLQRRHGAGPGDRGRARGPRRAGRGLRLRRGHLRRQRALPAAPAGGPGPRPRGPAAVPARPGRGVPRGARARAGCG